MREDLIKDIPEFDLSNMKILNTDMKVNTKDFFHFLKNVQLLCQGDGLTPEQMRFMKYFYNRYVLVPQLRAEEKNWFDIVKDLTDGKYDAPGVNKEDLDSLLKDSKGFYSDAKNKRMKTVEYLDSIKNVYF